MNKKFVINFSVALHFNTFLSTYSDEIGFSYFVERFWREVFLNSRFEKSGHLFTRCNQSISENK